MSQIAVGPFANQLAENLLQVYLFFRLLRYLNCLGPDQLLLLFWWTLLRRGFLRLLFLFLVELYRFLCLERLNWFLIQSNSAFNLFLPVFIWLLWLSFHSLCVVSFAQFCTTFECISLCRRGQLFAVFKRIWLILHRIRWLCLLLCHVGI